MANINFKIIIPLKIEMHIVEDALRVFMFEPMSDETLRRVEAQFPRSIATLVHPITLKVAMPDGKIWTIG